jgi:hypothetical protein
MGLVQSLMVLRFFSRIEHVHFNHLGAACVASLPIEWLSLALTLQSSVCFPNRYVAYKALGLGLRYPDEYSHAVVLSTEGDKSASGFGEPRLHLRQS